MGAQQATGRIKDRTANQNGGKTGTGRQRHDAADDKGSDDKPSPIQMKLSELSSNFSNQLLDATQAWTKHIVDEAELAGLPDSAKAQMAQAAAAKELEGWLITLEFPSYYAVLTYADDRDLREELYAAYCTRASDQGPNAGEFDNGPLMEQILDLRQELAQLLDFLVLEGDPVVDEVFAEHPTFHEVVVISVQSFQGSVQ